MFLLLISASRYSRSSYDLDVFAGLNDKLYERRKAAALELEKSVRAYSLVPRIFVLISSLVTAQSRRTRRYTQDYPDHQPAMSDVHFNCLGPTYPERRPDRARSYGHRAESGFLEMAGNRHSEGASLFQ